MYTFLGATHVMQSYGIDNTEILKMQVDELRTSIKGSLEIYKSCFKYRWKIDTLLNSPNEELGFFIPRVSEIVSPMNIEIRINAVREILAIFIASPLASSHSDGTDFDLSVRIEKYARLSRLNDYFQTH